MSKHLKALNGMRTEIKKPIKDAMAKAVKEGPREILKRIPVSNEPGKHYKDTIKAELVNDFRAKISVGDKEKPAGPLEWGHKTKAGKHVSPRAFFYPAMKVLVKRHKARMKRVIKAAVKSLFS